VKDYLLTLLVAAAVTYLLTPLVRRGAIRVGAVTPLRERDVHTTPVPRLGGVAMYAGLAAGLLTADQIPQLRSQFGPTGMVPGLLLAGGLLVAIGAIDDKWGMSALAKLAGQVAAGAILVATGTELNWLPLPGNGTFAPTPDQSTLLTILLIVATINAVNFIDGLDGLAAGIVAIAAVSFLIYYYKMTNIVGVSALAAPALASAILVGVCLGFLPHNFHPARIFMGDTGAMLLGLVLAYAPISSIASLEPTGFSKVAQVNRYPEVMPLLLPAALLVIPYTDLLLAVVRRTRAGLSPFAADRKHLHHRLLDIGHSQRASVLVMYVWAALFSGSIVWFSLERTPTGSASNHHGQPVLVFVLITAAAVLALVLLSMPRLRRRDRAVAAEVAARAGAPPGPPGGLAAPQAGLATPQAGLAAPQAGLAAVPGAGGRRAAGPGDAKPGPAARGGPPRTELTAVGAPAPLSAPVPADPARGRAASAPPPDGSPAAPDPASEAGGARPADSLPAGPRPADSLSPGSRPADSLSPGSRPADSLSPGSRSAYSLSPGSRSAGRFRPASQSVIGTVPPAVGGHPAHERNGAARPDSEPPARPASEPPAGPDALGWQSRAGSPPAAAGQAGQQPRPRLATPDQPLAGLAASRGPLSQPVPSRPVPARPVHGRPVSARPPAALAETALPPAGEVLGAPEDGAP
jgi:UDP-GlcNAc:undecaprenyl-phosphate GlcNAc-1-phosphate transferase